MGGIQISIGLATIFIIMRLFIAVYDGSESPGSIRECTGYDVFSACGETRADLKNLALGTFPGAPPIFNAGLILLQAVALILLFFYWLRGTD